jgi:hypothetical protein
LFIHKEELNYAICPKMDGIGGQVKWNRSDLEIWSTTYFSLMKNLDLNKNEYNDMNIKRDYGGGGRESQR